MSKRERILQCVEAMKELRSVIEIVSSQFQDLSMLAHATQIMVVNLTEEALSTPPGEK